MTSDPLVLRWTMEVADVRETHRVPRARRRRRRTQAVLLVAAAALVALGFAEPRSRAPAFDVAGALVGLAVALVILPAIVSWRVWRAAYRHRGLIEARVSVDAIEVVAKGVRSEYGWAGVREVVETPGAFLLALAPGPIGPYVVLPKRALTDPERLPALRDLLTSRVPRPTAAAVRSGTPPPGPSAG